MTRAERVLEGEVLAHEGEEQRAVRERLAFLAWLLDSSIPIPGTRYNVGLFPFIGDLIGVLVSSYILAEANRLGVGRGGRDWHVPLFGDLFDAAWKANVRNTARQSIIPRAPDARAGGAGGAERLAALPALRRALRLACARWSGYARSRWRRRSSRWRCSRCPGRSCASTSGLI